MADLLAEQPLLLLFACAAVGSVVGAISFRGFSLGPAAVLFTALALSAWDARLELPAELGSLGLALFAYCVGVAGGPSFFAALRHHIWAITAVAGGLVICGMVAMGVGGILGIDHDVVAGIYAGALTNTPALAAATEQVGGSGPTVGYSVSYLGGVLIMIAAAAWVLRRPDPASESENAPLVTRTVQVTQENLPHLGVLARAGGTPVVFSRVKQGETVEVARDDMHVDPGDLVSAVGHEPAVEAVIERIGTAAKEEITLDRRSLDMRRIALSNRKHSGRTIADLHLEQFNARATRVRRGDVDLMAEPHMRLHLGDRVRVIAPRHRIPDVSRHLGDSERGPGDLNPIGLSVGLAAGILLGLIAIPLPGGAELALGLAAGPLLVGLVLGRMARTGPVVWSLPYTASHLLQQLGILVFLAAAGSRAGGDLIDAVRGGQAPKIVLAGIIVTVGAWLTLIAVSKVFRLGGPHFAGVVAGAQTQPAVLAFAQERTGNDQRVSAGYALVFPAAMVTKILVGMALASMAAMGH